MPQKAAMAECIFGWIRLQFELAACRLVSRTTVPHPKPRSPNNRYNQIETIAPNFNRLKNHFLDPVDPNLSPNRRRLRVEGHCESRQVSKAQQKSALLVDEVLPAVNVGASLGRSLLAGEVQCS